MPLESAIPRELCGSCKDNPWGHSGWKDFYEDTSGASRFLRVDRSIRNIIDYGVEPQTLYEQSRNCKWCYMLIMGSRLPKSFEGFQQTGYEKMRVVIKFHAPPHASPTKVNSIYVGFSLNGPGGKLNMLSMRRLAVWSKPGENVRQIHHGSFCEDS